MTLRKNARRARIENDEISSFIICLSRSFVFLPFFTFPLDGRWMN